MCAICGIIDFKGRPVAAETLSVMAAAQRHRGPDAEGYFCENTPQATVGLGHCRLAIIDLNTGNQPIHNEDKTIWIVYNGEIYNFPELRAGLEKQGHAFYTKTDTEVIVHLYEQYGVECLSRLRGMFAFALWDKNKQQLLLARDRLGKKPLSYYLDGERLIFASEIKGIFSIKDLRPEMDMEAMHYYLTYQYVPGAYTMFKNVRKIPSGHYLVWNKQGVNLKRYWQADFSKKQDITIAKATDELLEKLEESTRLRLISDVPLGVFLSGGIDSSAIVAMMHRLGIKPVRTFSIGFAEKEYNELDFARETARHFSCEHHELLVQPDMIEILPKLIWHYNEPFADYSCIPTYYVAKMAREHVKVVLTGDGGDECFAGYLRYAVFKWTSWLDYLPLALRKGVSASISAMPDSPEMRSQLWQIKRFLRFAGYSGVRRYGAWLCAFDDAEKKALYHPTIYDTLHSIDPLALMETIYNQSLARDIIDKITAVDLETYLAGDLLVKMDIATMANSLEARAPFLDDKIIEFSAGLPSALKLRGLTSKYILKQAFKKILPQNIIQRPKKGFGIPIGRWFRQDLKPYISEILHNSRLAQEKILNQQFLNQVLEQHISGQEDFGYKLWALLNLELWYNTFIKP